MSSLISDAILAAIKHGDSVGWRSNKARREYMKKYNEALSMEDQFSDFFHTEIDEHNSTEGVEETQAQPEDVNEGGVVFGPENQDDAGKTKDSFSSSFKPLSEEEAEVDYDGEENSPQPEEKSSKKIPKKPRQPDDEGDEFIDPAGALHAKKSRSSSSSASSSSTTEPHIDNNSVGGKSDDIKQSVGTDRTEGNRSSNNGIQTG